MAAAFRSRGDSWSGLRSTNFNSTQHPKSNTIMFNRFNPYES